MFTAAQLARADAREGAAAERAGGGRARLRRDARGRPRRWLLRRGRRGRPRRRAPRPGAGRRRRDRIGDPRGGPPRGGDAPVRPPRAVRRRRARTGPARSGSPTATSSSHRAGSGSTSPSRTAASIRSACRPTSRSGVRTSASSSTGRRPRGSGSISRRATRCDGRPARRTRSISSATAARGRSGCPSATRAPSTRRATAPPPVTGSGSATPICWIRIERDLTDPADQALWGYAKNWRSGMVQHDRATTESELDTIVASAVVLDPLLGVSRPTSASRTAGSPGSGGPATRTSPTASTSRSARTPGRSPATA